MTNLPRIKTLWHILACMSLIASAFGIFDRSIYNKVVAENLMPGVLAQDILVAIGSIVMLFLVGRAKENDIKVHIVILGITGFIFYSYGIWVIERVYNWLYFLYLAIFGSSFFAIILAISNIRQDVTTGARLPAKLRLISAGFSIFIAGLFSSLWVSQLIPLIRADAKPESMYAIYILDLCFIMPLFVILAILCVKKHGLGLLMTPALFVKGFTVLFPLALGEALKRYYKPFSEFAPDMGQAQFYLALSIVFLILTTYYLKMLKIKSL